MFLSKSEFSNVVKNTPLVSIDLGSILFCSIVFSRGLEKAICALKNNEPKNIKKYDMREIIYKLSFLNFKSLSGKSKVINKKMIIYIKNKRIKLFSNKSTLDDNK